MLALPDMFQGRRLPLVSKHQRNRLIANNCDIRCIRESVPDLPHIGHLITGSTNSGERIARQEGIVQTAVQSEALQLHQLGLCVIVSIRPIPVSGEGKFQACLCRRRK